MILIVLSFLLLPFTILATPITFGAAGNLTLASITNNTGDVQLAKSCPSPPPDAQPISFGFDKLGVSGTTYG